MDSETITKQEQQMIDCNNKSDTGNVTKDIGQKREGGSSEPKVNSVPKEQEQSAETTNQFGHNESTTNKQHEPQDSSLSTAFTISFDDESNFSRKLGIRDSIRKFAPPKPNTIERPRPTKTELNQEDSMTSIESAPCNLSSKHSPSNRNSSSRSSSRRSNSSRHSNISDSAAFLIDRMLNCKDQQYNSLEQEILSANNKHSASSPKHGQCSIVGAKKGTSDSKFISKATSSTGEPLKRDSNFDNDIDHCDEKSDNGTYIVGTDPESDAARKKIDELFGVVRAAEASVIAESRAKTRELQEKIINGQSRVNEKKSISKERQEHINKLARRTSSSISPSSSSSRQDNIMSSIVDNRHRRPRGLSRHSRNSSCDRTTSNHQSHTANRHRKRSASQTSRHSSQKELSDTETRSSRSSLHNEPDTASQDNPLSSHPNMKFNRAFALRRARLGLGEPTVTNCLSTAQSFTGSEVDSVNPRRQQINTNTYRANQNHDSGTATFSRDDGGRFSLRMKNSVVSNRLNPVRHLTSTSKTQNTTLDSYVNKISACKQESPRNYSKIPHIPSSSMPYQSGDEYEGISPSTYRLLLKTGRMQQKVNTMKQEDEETLNNRFNFSLQNEAGYSDHADSRATSSIGGRRGSSLQLGALDSLVISAISSLSLKIRTSVCDVMVEQAKRLPHENETRMIVEEILPQLTANYTNPKSPTSVEEIDQSLYFDLAKTLKNLKKIEQMVDVITLISSQLSGLKNTSSTNLSMTNHSKLKQSSNRVGGIVRSSENVSNTEPNIIKNLSPI